MNFFCVAISAVIVVGVSCAPTPPAPPKAALNGDVGLQFLQTLSADDNHVFSPPALTSLLVCLLNGASGQTDKELRSLIGSDDKLSDLNQRMRTLFASLNQSRDLFPANELFVTSETTLDAAFVASVASIGCRVSNVDFKKAKDARKAVNTAVNKATNGRVGRLLRDPLDASNSWAAVQAFAAAPEWRTPFAEEPKKRSFLNHVSYVLPPMPISVPFLRTSGAFRARNDSALSSLTLELPLNGTKARSLHVIMPSTPLALQNLNENMTFADIQTAFEKTAKSVARPLVVVLPKLKLESEHDLLDSLFADLDFNVKVDLSAATKSATEQRVSTAFQRASLEFAETKGAPKEAEEEAKEEVVISRPFLAVIRDDESGEWLSVARIQSLVDESVVSFQFI